MIRRVTFILVVVAVVGLAVLTLFWFGQRRLIYFPDTRPPSLDRTGLTEVEAVTFVTGDGLRLDAWFVA